MKSKGMGKGWMFWTPRVIGLALILFLAIFSLDVFDGNYDFLGTLLALFMHNLPSIVLAFFLIVFWNKGIVPGAVFILGGLVYVVLILTNRNFEWFMLLWILQISVPAFFVGILFILDWNRRKNG
ncbi:MAG: hypothetical protein KKD18_01955 [Nanoarchaeota archaeon]|nr:hypothetical protein [Nanoarchaeota archaeon]MBU0977156.1 hypothetical protein [Nanoarchaeota archaeon]